MGKVSNLVPEGWSVKGIADLVTLQYGKSPREIFNENGPYPVIGTGGVTGATSSYLHEGGTTVIGRKGTINKPSYIKGRFWAIDTTYYGENYQDVDPKWFYYNISSFDLMRYNEASGVPSLNRDTLYAIQLLKPPLPEQQKIATILTSVDNVIEKTRAQIDKLKDLKTGMMQELLTKGIGHTEFKDSPLGLIPREWGIVNFFECTTRFYQGINTVADKVAYQNEGVQIIQAKHITSGELNFDGARYVSGTDYLKYSSKFQPSISDILFSNIGTIGKSVIVTEKHDFLIAWNVFLIRVEKYVQPKFMHYFLQYLDFLSFYDDLMTGNATKFVNKSAFGAIFIPVPSREEQMKIISALDSTDSRLSAVNSKLSALMKTKKALMQDLLTGKVRVKLNESATIENA